VWSPLPNATHKRTNPSKFIAITEDEEAESWTGNKARDVAEDEDKDETLV